MLFSLYAIIKDLMMRYRSLKVIYLKCINNNYIFKVLLIVLFEPNTNVENDSITCTWNKYAICLRLLQEMLKMKNLYKIMEEKLHISVRNIFLFFF